MSMTWRKANHSPVKPEDLLKYEIAGELGLLDKVLKDGWAGLTGEESGRIGGLLGHRKQQMGVGRHA